MRISTLPAFALILSLSKDEGVPRRRGIIAPRAEGARRGGRSPHSGQARGQAGAAFSRGRGWARGGGVRMRRLFGLALMVAALGACAPSRAAVVNPVVLAAPGRSVDLDLR